MKDKTGKYLSGNEVAGKIGLRIRTILWELSPRCVRCSLPRAIQEAW